jgi:hypothetical protein
VREDKNARPFHRPLPPPPLLFLTPVSIFSPPSTYTQSPNFFHPSPLILALILTPSTKKMTKENILFIGTVRHAKAQEAALAAKYNIHVRQFAKEKKIEENK